MAKNASAEENSDKRLARLQTASAWMTHAAFILFLLLIFLHKEPSPADANTTGSISGRVVAQSPSVGLLQLATLRRERAMPVSSATTKEETVTTATTPEQQARRDVLMDRLITTYPEFLSGRDGNVLIWRDGARMTFDDGRSKTFEERLAHPDVEDQFSVAYPSGPMLNDPEPEFDPGRFRNDAFFTRMYGDCHKGEVQKKLVDVVWLPKHAAKKIKFSSVNHAAEKLQQVSDELDALPSEMLNYLTPMAGTYNCRDIAGTERTSAHGWGIAIDLNAKFGDYWRWAKGGRYQYKNRIPWEIAAIFEKHGFIWGAKWYHYDSFHFEYRPEMFLGDDDAQAGNGAVPIPEKQKRNLD